MSYIFWQSNFNLNISQPFSTEINCLDPIKDDCAQESEYFPLANPPVNSNHSQ